MPLHRLGLCACLGVALGCWAPTGRDHAAADSAVATVHASVAGALDSARALYRRASYGSAGRLATAALDVATRMGDSSAMARALLTLGQVAYRVSDYPTAKARLERALALQQVLGQSDQVAQSYLGLGLVAWAESRLSEALELNAAAAATAAGPDSQRLVAAASINRGLVLSDLGRFTEALEAFERGRALSHDANDRRNEAAALTNLGMRHIWIGEPQRAIPWLRDAVTLARAVEARNVELNALGQLGTAYLGMGDLGRAIAVLDSAVAWARDLNLPDEEVGNLEALAGAYRVAGNHRRALELYAAAESTNTVLGLIQEAGVNQRHRAEVYRAQGELDLARALAERALATHQSAESDWQVFSDLLLLADLAHQTGDSAASVDYLGRARRLTPALAARIARAELALVEARIGDRDTDSHRVVRTLSGAQRDLEGGGYDEQWEAEWLRSRALQRLGRTSQALGAARRAVDLVERVRTTFSSQALRTSYAASRLAAYAQLIELLVVNGGAEEAFAVAAAANGRLGSAPAAIGGQASSGGEEEDLLRRIGHLAEELHAAETAPADEREPRATSELRRQLERARGEYEGRLIRRTERERREPEVSANATAAWAVRSALQPDELLVTYFVGPERALGFVVTHRSTTSFWLPVPSDVLGRSARVARDLLASPRSSREELRAALRQLHSWLLPPGAAWHGARLIVVPHGPLAYLPFAALLDGSQDRFLVEAALIVTLPNPLALPELRSRPASGGRVPAVVFAPLGQTLPATRREARAIRDILSRAELIEGRQATEARFRQVLSEGRIVHLASHGTMNPVNPLFSRVDLAPRAVGTPQVDGRLEVHEVLDLKIRSPLVFLSGCETGVGVAWSTDFARGEDVATLGGAFLAAGADNVIATLWPVEDDGAAAFAARFYQQLAGGVNASDALAEAQRGTLSDRRYEAPYYWAGYQLAGVGLGTGLGANRTTSSVAR